MTWLLISFTGYLASLVAIGLVARKFASGSMGAYFMGAGKINRWVVAISSVVSGRSAWLLLGFTGLSYSIGFSAVWACLGYILAELWMFLKLAPKVKQHAQSHDCITIPDLYASRFPERGNTVRLISGLIILIFMVAYVSAQFVAGGKAFSASFEISQFEGMLLTILIIMLYTLVGGFLAVSITDVVQGVFMILALLLLPVVIYWSEPLYDAFMLEWQSNPGFFSFTAISAGTMVGFLGIGLGSPGSPHILVRFMSIKNASSFRFVALTGTLANVFMALGAITCGMVARLVFPDLTSVPGEDPEQIYPHLASTYLHPALTGIIVASVFAAIMSTADSQLLVGASTVVRDFYQKLLGKGKHFDTRHWVNLSRFAVVFMVALAWAMAVLADELVFWLVLFAWAGLGASIGPTLAAMFFYRRVNAAGIIFGLISGAVTVFVWKLIPLFNELIYELVPAFAVGLLATWLGSVLSRNNSQ